MLALAATGTMLSVREPACLTACAEKKARDSGQGVRVARRTREDFSLRASLVARRRAAGEDSEKRRCESSVKFRERGRHDDRDAITMVCGSDVRGGVGETGPRLAATP